MIFHPNEGRYDRLVLTGIVIGALTGAAIGGPVGWSTGGPPRALAAGVALALVGAYAGYFYGSGTAYRRLHPHLSSHRNHATEYRTLGVVLATGALAGALGIALFVPDERLGTYLVPIAVYGVSALAGAGYVGWRTRPSAVGERRSILFLDEGLVTILTALGAVALGGLAGYQSQPMTSVGVGILFTAVFAGTVFGIRRTFASGYYN